MRDKATDATTTVEITFEEFKRLLQMAIEYVCEGG